MVFGSVREGGGCVPGTVYGSNLALTARWVEIIVGRNNE